ncbi:MAG: terminase family protein [Pseudomonadota bacterium]|nr:terminase family protein [Pseudomonadota bacterium]
MNILEACRDEKLFRPWFRDVETYRAWFAFLATLFALPMDADQLALFQRHTGRTQPPSHASNEGWLIVGRRGGKSFVMALVAVYLACFRSYRQYLAPGERATVMLIAADRKQARVIARYISGMLNNIPLLRKLIEKETAESFDLTNGVTIEIGTASFRSTRGYSFAAVICDELAFWRTGDDSANPDFEILSAVRPGLATIPGAMLLCASSPYAKRGALWDAFRRYWAKDDAPLVWKAATREMNPTLPQRTVDEAMERDRSSALAEYMGEFRTDIEAFVQLETVEQCIRTDFKMRPPIKALRGEYFAFVDPSGGSSDSMTLAIAHRNAKTDDIVLDALLERVPPFNPEQAVDEFCRHLRLYGINSVEGDRYAGEWPREQFRKRGFTYRVAGKTRSELYLDLLPVLNSGMVDLLDNQKLINQLISLERRVARGGRESIDHPPGGHDDCANAVAGVVQMTNRWVRNPKVHTGSWKAY